MNGVRFGAGVPRLDEGRRLEPAEVCRYGMGDVSLILEIRVNSRRVMVSCASVDHSAEDPLGGRKESAAQYSIVGIDDSDNEMMPMSCHPVHEEVPDSFMRTVVRTVRDRVDAPVGLTQKRGRVSLEIHVILAQQFKSETSPEEGVVEVLEFGNRGFGSSWEVDSLGLPCALHRNNEGMIGDRP